LLQREHAKGILRVLAADISIAAERWGGACLFQIPTAKDALIKGVDADDGRGIYGRVQEPAILLNIERKK